VLLCIHVLDSKKGKRDHFLLTLLVFVSTKWCPTHITSSFRYICLRFVYPMLPGSLNCPRVLYIPLWNHLTFIQMCDILLLRHNLEFNTRHTFTHTIFEVNALFHNHSAYRAIIINQPINNSLFHKLLTTNIKSIALFSLT
jgi:hypothetical protein